MVIICLYALYKRRTVYQTPEITVSVDARDSFVIVLLYAEREVPHPQIGRDAIGIVTIQYIP